MPTYSEPLGAPPPTPLTRRLASQFGVSDDDLVGPAWPTGQLRGVHRWTETDRADPALRIAEVGSLFRVDAAVTGWAGCWLHGANWLDGLASNGKHLLPVPLALQPHMQTRRKAGLHVIRSQFEPGDLTQVGDIPVLAPLRCTYDGARTSSLVEAVVLIDTMLHFKLTDLDELEAYVLSHPRGLGNPMVRRAVRFADDRVMSPPETRARMLWMLGAGLPRPEVNIPVYDSEGQYLGRPDLLDLEAGVVVEYDGAYHADLDQRTYDHEREETFERHNLIVVRLTSLSLSSQRAGAIARLRADRRRGLARDRSRDRWHVRPDDLRAN